MLERNCIHPTRLHVVDVGSGYGVVKTERCHANEWWKEGHCLWRQSWPAVVVGVVAFFVVVGCGFVQPGTTEALGQNVGSGGLQKD